MEYHPDKWVVIKITSEKGVHYRVFATWLGGFTSGDSWKMNSGITKVESKDNYINFYGVSGSVYCVRKECYGMSSYSRSVLKQLQETSTRLNIEIMGEDTNWHFLRLIHECSS